MEAELSARARELHTLVDHLPHVVVRYVCSYAGPTRAMAVFMLGGCVHARPGPAPPRARSMQRDAENIAVTLVFDEHVRRCIKAGEEVLQLAWDTLYAGGVDIGVPG
jgi:hypothetical protein